MATYNDVTGDRLINTPKKSPSVSPRATPTEEKVFEVFNCKRCHIKVSTSNGHCPCCGENLKGHEALDKLAQLSQELGDY